MLLVLLTVQFNLEEEQMMYQHDVEERRRQFQDYDPSDHGWIAVLVLGALIALTIGMLLLTYPGRDNAHTENNTQLTKQAPALSVPPGQVQPH